MVALYKRATSNTASCTAASVSLMCDSILGGMSLCSLMREAMNSIMTVSEPLMPENMRYASEYESRRSWSLLRMLRTLLKITRTAAIVRPEMLVTPRYHIRHTFYTPLSED